MLCKHGLSPILGYILGWTWLALIVWFSLDPQPPDLAYAFPQQDKLEHLIAYAILMIWFSRLYPRLRQRRAYAIGFILLGAFLEVMQGWGGVRVFDYFDMMANALGVGLGYWLGRSVKSLVPVAQGKGRMPLQ